MSVNKRYALPFFLVNLIRCKLQKVTCHYPKEGEGMVSPQPIVIIIFYVTIRGEGVEEVGPMSLYMEIFVDGIPKQSVPTIDKNVQ